MKPRTLVAFAAVTLVLLAGAVWSIVNQRGNTVLATGGDPVFPALKADINKAAEIDLEWSAGKFTIKRADKKWVLEQREGYPVPFDRVRSALVSLAELKYLEPKTKEPSRYDRLWVEDITPKAKGAVKVTVKDDKGKLLASAIMGRVNENLYGKAGGGTYLRKTGEAQSWLAEGVAKFGTSHKDWIDKNIVSVKQDETARVVMHWPGDPADSWTASKPEKARHFTLDTVPDGKKLKSDKEIDSILDIMDGLDMDDVKKAADVKFPDPPQWVEFTTYDGLIVHAEVVSPKEYEYWAKFSARVADDAKDPEKAKRRADEINARCKGWAYAIAAGYGEKLTKKLPDMVEPVKEPAS